MKSYIYFLVLLLLLTTACSKNFLEEKPDKKLAIPETLDDFQALLDNTDIMNNFMPVFGEISSDDYYILHDRWNTLTSPEQKNAYIWAKNIYEGGTYVRDDWAGRYQQVFYANTVLEGLSKLNAGEQPEKYNNIKGSALFYRAFAFYQLAQLFCAPYIMNGDNSGVGIPLQLTADINATVTRASIAATYEQMIDDLKKALPLLPETAVNKLRPCKTAALALLSRVYLSMQDYTDAQQYAEVAIAKNNSLIDFNTLALSAAFPMQRYNDEVIFHSTIAAYTILLTTRLIIDSILYRSYETNDLRKTAWFRINTGNQTFKGSYDGSTTFFNGLATDECYLTKAECLARNNNVPQAMDVLNQLLVTRCKAGTFVNRSADNSSQALALILTERRKELLFRGIRWTDLRRNNLNPETATTLTRVLNGTTYTLKPGSKNYVLPIRDNVIQMSGIAQNERE